jgi:hypothetical protein
MPDGSPIQFNAEPAGSSLRLFAAPRNLGTVLAVTGFSLYVNATPCIVVNGATSARTLTRFLGNFIYGTMSSTNFAAAGNPWTIPVQRFLWYQV